MANTIQSFRVRPLIVPMPEPHRTASGAVTASPLVLVDVPTSDGAVGHEAGDVGFAPLRGGGQAGQEQKE